MRVAHVLHTVFLASLIACAPLTVNAEEMRLGFTGPLSGPSRALGEQLSAGVALGFARLNASGQLPFTVSVIAEDDGYEPSRTVPVILKLVEEDNIVGLISSVGTPTLVSAIPTLNTLQLPLIYPFTGSSLFKGNDIHSLVFTHRADYEKELTLLTQTVVENFNIAPDEVAIFVQQDSYGEVTMRSLIKALEAYGLSNAKGALQVRYTRNSASMDTAAAQILAHPTSLKVIFLISTSPAAAELITVLDDVGMSPLFASLSLLSNERLSHQLQQTHAKILSTQFHPCKQDLTHPMVQAFFRDLQQYGDSSTATGALLDGYIAAREIENILLHFKPSHAPNRAEFLAYLKRYQQLHKNTEIAVVENTLLSHTEEPIWIKIQDHKTGSTYCGHTMPDKYLKR